MLSQRTFHFLWIPFCVSICLLRQSFSQCWYFSQPVRRRHSGNFKLKKGLKMNRWLFWTLLLSTWLLYYLRQKKTSPPSPANTWTFVRCGCLPKFGIRQVIRWCRAKVGNRNPAMSRWLQGGGRFFLSMRVVLRTVCTEHPWKKTNSFIKIGKQ